MTTTNKQRRAQRMKRDKERKAFAAAQEEAKRLTEIRNGCLRQLLDAGFSETDFAKLEREAEHLRVPLTWRVTNFIKSKKPEPPVPQPEPYFAPGDTFSVSPTKTAQPPSRTFPRRHPVLRSLLVLSLLTLPPK